MRSLLGVNLYLGAEADKELKPALQLQIGVSSDTLVLQSTAMFCHTGGLFIGSDSLSVIS